MLPDETDTTGNLCGQWAADLPRWRVVACPLSDVVETGTVSYDLTRPDHLAPELWEAIESYTRG